MKFPFAVKHNGVMYEAGKEVPIGKEPVKEIENEDKTASELSNELKERFNIDMAPQKGKAKLQEALEEAEKAAKEAEEAELENEDPEANEEDLENEDPEAEDPEANENESFLDKIINE